MPLFGTFELEAVRAVNFYRGAPGWPGYGLPALLARALDVVADEEQKPEIVPKGTDG